MPAFTVSINTPEGNAGEYGDTLLVRGGYGLGGLGGLGRRFFDVAEGVAVLIVTVADVDEAFDPLADAGCFPFITAVAWGF